MKVDKFIRSSETNFGDYFLQDGVVFQIPLNQRPWSWKEVQLNGFWQDLLNATNRFYHIDHTAETWSKKEEGDASPYFVGALVAAQRDEEFELVDGQQRITAVTMIAAAFLEELLKIEPQQGEEKQHLESSKALVIRWLESSPGTPRLRVDEQFNDAFYAYISKPVGRREKEQAFKALELDINELPHHSRLKNSYDSIRLKVEGYIGHLSVPGKISATNAVLDTLGQYFVCIHATIYKEAFALEVFKSLNAKGIPLSHTDNIKNELFVHSKNSEHIEIRQLWIDLSENAPKGLIDNFLRLRHISIIGPCKSKELYKTILEKEIQVSGTEMVKLLKEWKKDSEWAARLTLGKSYSGLNAKSKHLLDALFGKLKITYGIIFLLVAAKRFLPGDINQFETATKLILNYCFRLITICDKDTPELETNLGNVARKFYNDEGVTLYDVARELRKSSPDDVFKMAFENKSVQSTDTRYYIYSEIEKHLGGFGPVPAAGDHQSIEHIMPRNFSKAKSRDGEWKWAKEKPDLHREYLNRLGNMCLIEKDINSHVESYDFNAKQAGTYPGAAIKRKGEPRKHYGNSEMHLVKELADPSKYSAWSFEAIDIRQKHLAELAVKIWTLKVDEL